MNGGTYFLIDELAKGNKISWSVDWYLKEKFLNLNIDIGKDNSSWNKLGWALVIIAKELFLSHKDRFGNFLSHKMVLLDLDKKLLTYVLTLQNENINSWIDTGKEKYF